MSTQAILESRETPAFGAEFAERFRVVSSAVFVAGIVVLDDVLEFGRHAADGPDTRVQAVERVSAFHVAPGAVSRPAPFEGVQDLVLSGTGAVYADDRGFEMEFLELACVGNVRDPDGPGIAGPL